MRSFIFNFNLVQLTVCLLVVIVFIMGVGKMWILNSVPAPLRPLPQSFWWRKTHLKEQFDVVVIGDSRVYRGISPDDMETAFHDGSVLNFGYSNAGLNTILLEAGVQKLAPTGWRIIVLGVSPLTLTEFSGENAHYLQYKNSSRPVDYYTDLFSSQSTLFALRVLLRIPHENEGYSQIPYQNGWVESSRILKNHDAALKLYRKRFREYSVSERIQQELFQTVQQLKQQGITTFAFRPPSTYEMEELENELSGFNERQFKVRFAKAGGYWIDLEDRFGFHSYDGSHLRAKSARVLSKEIAKRILQTVNTVVIADE